MAGCKPFSDSSVDECLHRYPQCQWNYLNIDDFLRQDVDFHYCSDAFYQFRHSLHYGYSYSMPVPVEDDVGEAQASLEAVPEFSLDRACSLVTGERSGSSTSLSRLVR